MKKLLLGMITLLPLSSFANECGGELDRKLECIVKVSSPCVRVDDSRFSSGYSYRFGKIERYIVTRETSNCDVTQYSYQKVNGTAARSRSLCNKYRNEALALSCD